MSTKKEQSQSQLLANPLMTSFATTLIGMVLLHEIVLPEKVYGQRLDVSKQAGLHLVCAKVTTATTCAPGAIAPRSQQVEVLIQTRT